MALIGTFTRTGSGFSGRLRTLCLDVELVLVPSEPNDAENAPDYRIHLDEGDDAPEIGAAWKRTGEKAGEYVSLLIDDPSLPRPIRVNLFQSADDKSAWGLHWSRPPKAADRS
jgi:uncharacterized protein (DUF736 family)